MVLPEAVGVTTTAFCPARAAAMASAWWVYSRSMPRSFRAATRRGSSAAGQSAYRAGAGGRVCQWTMLGPMAGSLRS